MGCLESDPAADLFHVLITAAAVSFVETYLYEGGVLRRVRRVNGGEVRCHADIRDNHSQIVGRNLLADDVLNSSNFVGGHLQPRAGRSFDVEYKLARFGPREKCDSKEWVRRNGSGEEETCCKKNS